MEAFGLRAPSSMSTPSTLGVALLTLPANAPDCRKLPILPTCEPLEERRLLSAVLDAGVIQVKGTSAADVIKVSKSRSTLTIKIGTTTTTFAAGGVDAIRIRGLDGNDSITVGGTLKIPLIVYGGNGKHTLLGAPGADKLKRGARGDSNHGDKGQDNLNRGRANSQLL